MRNILFELAKNENPLM